MEIAKFIEDKYYNLKQARIQQYTHEHNNASEIGHPCERFLVFSRTKWDQKPLHDVSLQCIFDEGKRQEESLVRDLLDAGIEFIESQKPLYDQKLKLSARLDGKIVISYQEVVNNKQITVKQAYPVEIKSMSPYSFEKINTVKDMFDDIYACKYPAQLTLYLYLDAKEKGYFILKNKSTGQIKVIELTLDYEYAEQLIQKIERINHYVDNNEVPPVTVDATVCKTCPFLQVCMPDIKNTSIIFDDDSDLVKLINRRNELQKQLEQTKAIEKELRSVEELIKKAVTGKEKIIAGDYLITGKYVKRAGYEVKETQYWTYKIESLKQEASDAT